MTKEKADETVTVRMPKGKAAQIRAATGQPFSRLVRWTMLALLEKYNITDSVKIPENVEADIKALIKDKQP
jgi:hypothetical protein